LEAFGRRPPVFVAPPCAAGIRNLHKSGREQMQQMQIHNADLLDYFVGTDE